MWIEFKTKGRCDRVSYLSSKSGIGDQIFGELLKPKFQLSGLKLPEKLFTEEIMF